MIMIRSRFTFSLTIYTATPGHKQHHLSPLQCAHLQYKHVLLVVVPEPVVVHVVPEELEGLPLFPALQGGGAGGRWRRGDRRKDGGREVEVGSTTKARETE